MEINKAKQTIITILQNALMGHLDPSSNFKPQDVADAIEDKINFGKCYNDVKNDKILSNIINDIKCKQDEMNKCLNDLKENDKLLANFIRGKITAYDEILNYINNI